MFSTFSHETGGFMNTENCVNFTSPPPPEPFCCHETARCDGCPYPATGFICWCGDGTCMRTEMDKIRLRDAEEKGGK